MINLLSAEFYKLRKSMSFKVSAGLAVLFTVAIYILQELLLSGLVGNVDKAMIEEMSNIPHMLKQMFGQCNIIIFVTIYRFFYLLTGQISYVFQNEFFAQMMSSPLNKIL